MIFQPLSDEIIAKKAQPNTGKININRKETQEQATIPKYGCQKPSSASAAEGLRKAQMTSFQRQKNEEAMMDQPEISKQEIQMIHQKILGEINRLSSQLHEQQEASVIPTQEQATQEATQEQPTKKEKKRPRVHSSASGVISNLNEKKMRSRSPYRRLA